VRRAERGRSGGVALLSAISAALVLSACGRHDGVGNGSPSPVARAHDVRIVTLAPSLTEIVYAIGCGDKLVADTSYDDYPAAARLVPHVADLVNVDLERLSALRPTVVLALHDQEREAAPIDARLHVTVRYLPNRNLDDLFVDIASVGRACGMAAAAAGLSRSLHARIAAVARTAAHYRERPSVFFLLDLPGFTAGSRSFIDDLIRLAGGRNTAGGIVQPYPDVSTEALLAMDPQVLVVARDAEFGSAVQAQEPWRSMRAVRDGRIVRPPSDDILERNGPRVVEGLEWLVKAIHQ
jgi:cobalamin transport system substrate-binding protein